jgi:hypothetical protein
MSVERVSGRETLTAVSYALWQLQREEAGPGGVGSTTYSRKLCVVAVATSQEEEEDAEILALTAVSYALWQLQPTERMSNDANV